MVLTLGIGLAVETGAQAATLTVTTAEDIEDVTDGVLSLREAIAEAQDGDRITFDASLSGQPINIWPEIDQDFNFLPLFIDKDLAIEGIGVSQLTLHIRELSSIVILGNAVVTISDLSIAGPRGDPNLMYFTGGGLSNRGKLTLDRIAVMGSLDTALSNSGERTLIDTLVSENDDFRRGPTVISNSGTMTLINSKITDNTADIFVSSGTIFNGGTMTLMDSTVSNNEGNIRNAGVLLLLNSTINGNTGDFTGGGILNTGTTTLVSSTVSDNVATFVPRFASSVPDICGGGGIFNTGSMDVLNSTITSNLGKVHGGGFVSCRGGGGGILNDGGSVTLSHTIVAGNTVNDVGEISGPPNGGPDCEGVVTSLGYNLVGAGTGCPIDGLGDLTVLPGDVFTDIIGPLQNNGGPTDTHALLNNADNHAIDSGNPAGCLDQEGEALTTDQRGFPRPNEGGGMAICDIGAVELQQLIPGDLDQNGCVDRTDLTMIFTAIRGTASQELSHDLNGDGDVNIADARKLVTLFTNARGLSCL